MYTIQTSGNGTLGRVTVFNKSLNLDPVTVIIEEGGQGGALELDRFIVANTEVVERHMDWVYRAAFPLKITIPEYAGIICQVVENNVGRDYDFYYPEDYLNNNGRNQAVPHIPDGVFATRALPTEDTPF